MSADTMTKYAFRLVTPEGVVFEDEVISVVFTAHDGRMGVLSRHQPFLILMKAGVLKVALPHKELWFAARDGIGQMDSSNRLTLLADGARLCSDKRDAQRLIEERSHGSFTL